MFVFARFACLFGRHEPVRRHVGWNITGMIGHCRHCGAPISRKAHRHWRVRKT